MFCKLVNSSRPNCDQIDNCDLLHSEMCYKCEIKVQAVQQLPSCLTGPVCELRLSEWKANQSG